MRVNLRSFLNILAIRRPRCQDIAVPKLSVKFIQDSLVETAIENFSERN